jgi:hypothetical protein
VAARPNTKRARLRAVIEPAPSRNTSHRRLSFSSFARLAEYGPTSFHR